MAVIYSAVTMYFHSFVTSLVVCIVSGRVHLAGFNYTGHSNLPNDNINVLF